jgi:hypothetical protein
MQKGNLIIRPLEANLTHNTEFIGKMSPYLKCIIGNESKCTQAAKKAHKNPTWDSELVFRYHGEQSLRCELWNKEKLSGDDLIGYGTFDLGNFIRTGQFMGDIPLFYKDKDAGFLRLSMNFFEDGSPYNPFSSQQLPAKSYLVGGYGTTMGQSMPVIPSQSVLAGSTMMGTNVETTFLPSQTGLQTQRTTYVQNDLEPIIHKETQRLYEQPIYIQQRPVIHEKTVIIERPIITEKTIIDKEIPIIKEMCELRETTYYQKQEPVLIRENPIVRKDDLITSLDKMRLEGEPIVTRQTEVRREAPQYRSEQSEVYEREVIHERPIIHEKDIIHVEKPFWIEKPEILERPVLQAGHSQFYNDGTIKREVYADDLTIPNEALRHTDRVVMKEPAVFMKERPEIFEKEVFIEKPIFYEQPVIYTENQEIHEQGEFIQRRGRRVEQPIVERSELLVVRNDDQNLQNLQNVNYQNVNLLQRDTLQSQRLSDLQSQGGLQQGSKLEGQRSTYDVA